MENPTTTKEESSTTLLSLPRELRDEIYIHYFQNYLYENKQPWTVYLHSDGELRKPPRLLHTSRQLREEGIAAWCSTARFEILIKDHNTAPAMTWLRANSHILKSSLPQASEISIVVTSSDWIPHFEKLDFGPEDAWPKFFRALLDAGVPRDAVKFRLREHFTQSHVESCLRRYQDHEFALEAIYEKQKWVHLLTTLEKSLGKVEAEGNRGGEGGHGVDGVSNAAD